MFGLVHLLESFALEEQLQAFVAIVPELITVAPDWTKILHSRILNDKEACHLYRDNLPKILGLKPRPSRTALYYNIGVRVTSNVGRTTTNLTNSIVKVRGFQHNPC